MPGFGRARRRAQASEERTNVALFATRAARVARVLKKEFGRSRWLSSLAFFCFCEAYRNQRAATGPSRHVVSVRAKARCKARRNTRYSTDVAFLGLDFSQHPCSALSRGLRVAGKNARRRTHRQKICLLIASESKINKVIETSYWPASDNPQLAPRRTLPLERKPA